jgi:membrane fusion protein (multidrug efflux system)
VYRVTPDDLAVRAPVTIGGRTGGMVEILTGLAEGERLVVDGTVKVRDGGKVRPVAPGATAQAAA